MKDQDKTREQLIRQLTESRQEVAELQALRVERKKADDALRESEERFRALTESTSDWIWEVDAQGVYTYASPKIKDLLGYEPEEVVGKTPFDLMPEEEAGRVVSRFTAAADSHIPFKDLENWNRHKDGRLILLETSGVPFFDSTGNLRGYRGIDRDITDRKRAEEALQEAHDELEMRVEERTAELVKANERLAKEIEERLRADEALRESEERYRTLVETMNEGLGVLDQNGVLTYCNSAFSRTLGYSSEDLIGESALDYVDEGSRNVLIGELSKRERGEPRNQYEVALIRKDGGRVPVIVSAQGIYDRQGLFQGTFAVATDISDRKLAEDRLSASLGDKDVLLREIHHRVKNNLAVVTSLLRMQSRQTKDEAHREMLADTRSRIRSMTLAHELLYQSESLAIVNVKEYVGRLVDSLAASYGRAGTRIALKKEIEPVSFGPDTLVPLGLILTELVSNCFKHAFPDGGNGRILVRLRSIGEDKFELTVRDNGIGMPEGVGKDNPQCFGLSLAGICSDQLAGEIQTFRNDGTEFRVKFRGI